jgi:hypothetical protein
MRYFILFLFVCFHTIVLGQQSKRVLFIGNSYTATNNLPGILQNIATSTGDTIYFESSTPGGYTFEAHCTNATTLNKIAQGNWDFVVLQEQSQLPSFPDDQVNASVFPFAKKLDSLIHLYSPCATTVFYMTWGRKNGDASNCSIWPPVCTYNGMDSLLYARYMQMAENNEAIVSPVGAAWKKIRTAFPSIELYAADGSHPSLYGSYAAACCFYSVLFRKNPTAIAYNGNINIDIATNIKNAVAQTVYDSLINWHVGSYDTKAAFTYQTNQNEISFTNLSANYQQIQWDFGDGNTSNNANPMHTYYANGLYNVTLIASADCNKTDTISKLIEITSLSNDALYVFPNPAKNEINVYQKENDIKSIWLIDALGKKFPIAFTTQNNLINIQLKGLSAGVYFMSCVGKTHTITKKIILQ